MGSMSESDEMKRYSAALGRGMDSNEGIVWYFNGLNLKVDEVAITVKPAGCVDVLFGPREPLKLTENIGLGIDTEFEDQCYSCFLSDRIYCNIRKTIPYYRREERGMLYIGKYKNRKAIGNIYDLKPVFELKHTHNSKSAAIALKRGMKKIRSVKLPAVCDKE